MVNEYSEVRKQLTCQPKQKRKKEKKRYKNVI